MLETVNALAINRYDDYGQPEVANLGRFQYTGQVWLDTAGVYNYKARSYHPRLGRFLQSDPIGYADGMNLYAYVGNDPVNRRDPSGMLADIVVTGPKPNPFDNLSLFAPYQPGLFTPYIPSTDLSVLDDPYAQDTYKEDPISVTGKKKERPRVADTGSVASFRTAVLSFTVPNIQTLQKSIRDRAKDAFCALSPLEISGGADAYLGVGASASLGISLDIRTLQFRGGVSATLGVGFGGGLGVGAGAGATKSGYSQEVSGTLAAGPGSVTVSQGGSLEELVPNLVRGLVLGAVFLENTLPPATPDLTGACNGQ